MKNHCSRCGMAALLPLFLLAACGQPAPKAPSTADVKTIGNIERLSPELDAIIAQDAKIEVLAEGYNWSEGPVWVPDGGYLLFSDVPENTVFKWKEGEGASVYLKPSWRRKMQFSQSVFRNSSAVITGMVAFLKSRTFLVRKN